jgi:hypothetical protein
MLDKLQLHLRETAALTALVPAARIVDGVAADGTKAPWITLNVVGRPRLRRGCRQVDIQITVFDTQKGRARAIADVVETAAAAFKGKHGVFAVYPEGAVDLYEQATKLHYVPVTTELWYPVKAVYEE